MPTTSWGERTPRETLWDEEKIQGVCFLERRRRLSGSFLGEGGWDGSFLGECFLSWGKIFFLGRGIPPPPAARPPAPPSTRAAPRRSLLSLAPPSPAPPRLCCTSPGPAHAPAWLSCLPRTSQPGSSRPARYRPITTYNGASLKQTSGLSLQLGGIGLATALAPCDKRLARLWHETFAANVHFANYFACGMVIGVVVLSRAIPAHNNLGSPWEAGRKSEDEYKNKNRQTEGGSQGRRAGAFRCGSGEGRRAHGARLPST